MELLYLAKFSYQNDEDSGIVKKIHYQKKAFQKKDIKVNIISTDYKYLYFNKKKLKNFKNIYIGKLFWIKDALTKENIEKHDVFYIRNSSVDFGLIFALKKIKNKKIFLEIPTYPYDNEKKMNSLKNIITNLSDKISRKFLKNLVYKIVTYSKDEKIWDIPCINISNGIDLEEVKIKEKAKINKKDFVFTSVSNCSIWHGIDIFLLSLIEYGKVNVDKNIIFNIIGSGNELENLKKIVCDNKYLTNVVKFQGFKTKNELDDIYNETDIGVGSLGIHRIGLKEVQPLKNREYAGKGIPFIISFDDPEFRNSEYVYNKTKNEELLNIEKVIKWYEKNKFESEIIREDAKRFTWDIQIKKIIDNI